MENDSRGLRALDRKERFKDQGCIQWWQRADSLFGKADPGEGCRAPQRSAAIGLDFGNSAGQQTRELIILDSDHALLHTTITMS